VSVLDKRLHAYRDDLADMRLKGQVKAAHFVDGAPAQCVIPATRICKSPLDDAMQLTQVLMGETMKVFERKNGWAWVQLDGDDYVGYLREQAIRDNVVKTTHRIAVPMTHLYPDASIKTQPAPMVPMHARICVTEEVGEFLKLMSNRYVYAVHATASTEKDFVSVAERFLNAPYLWGGKTAMGIDCSGLVQIALAACGVDGPRDSDMQEQGLGDVVAKTDLKRGDLVFWKGHVGIMRDDKTLLHANGHHMQVVSEPLEHAVARIAATGSHITSVKRLQ
jgi:cell wall-associated NlpC family hydrolase